MGWWENIYSFADGLSDNVGRLQSLLKEYIKDYALWGAGQANRYFSILDHTWSDVRNLIDDKVSGYYSDVNDFYYILTNKLENEYSILGKSWYNITNYVDDAISGFQTQINGLSTNASSLYTYAHTILNNKINGLSQDIDNINDSLNIVTRTALATVNYIATESERRWGILKKSWSDITNLINSSINNLKTDIINPLSSKLTVLDTNFNNLVNTTIKNIASEVTSLTVKLNKLSNDVVAPIAKSLQALSNQVAKLPGWVWLSFEDITKDFVEEFIKIFNASEDKSVRFLTALGIGAGEVITTILDTPKDMVAWIKNDIADVFEDILDRVFR